MFRTQQIDALNIGLISLALALAVTVPFELQVFAYAVLGPLHYLTEIAWLHERRYFTRGPADVVLLGLLALPPIIAIWQSGPASSYAAPLLFVAFGMSLVIVVVSSLGVRLLSLLALAAAAEGCSSNEAFQVGLLLLPTLIHVLLFTAAFMITGVMRARTVAGIGAVIAFVGAVAACLAIDRGLPFGPPSEYVQQSYQPFAFLNAIVIRLFGLDPMQSFGELFTSASSISVTRLIAFAYTYHYFNWFSKTSIIGWHRVSRSRLAAAVAVWIACVGMYAWDFLLGMTVLYSLSLGHVILEFPLNHRTFLHLFSLGRSRAALRGRLEGPGF